MHIVTYSSVCIRVVGAECKRENNGGGVRYEVSEKPSVGRGSEN